MFSPKIYIPKNSCFEAKPLHMYKMNFKMACLITSLFGKKDASSSKTQALTQKSPGELENIEAIFFCNKNL